MTSQRTVSRLSRILALIPFVLANEGVTVSELVERFGYSEAQLAKDLDTVFVCGLPGYGPGDLMEAYIDEDEVIIDAADYFSRAPRMTSLEGLSLLASGMAVIAAGQGTSALDSAVDKLQKALLPDATGGLAVDVGGESSLLAPLREASRDSRVVRITYRSLAREEETVREIEPWNVFTTIGNWYVQGHCRLAGAERVFRVDRIRDLEPTGEEFERPALIPEPGVGYSPTDDDVVCEILLGPGAAWVLDYYPLEVVEQTVDGTLVRFSSLDAELPARLLLRLGGKARLVEGEEVARRMETLGRQVLSRYT